MTDRKSAKGGIFTVKNPILREVLDWAAHIILAVIIGFLIVTYVAQITIVHGSSMEPTLQDGNILLIEKITPRFGKLHYGDIITLNVPENVGREKKTIIKRVIGLENDTVEIRDGKVYVNGKMLNEDYINGDVTLPEMPQYNKVTVPKGQVYVLGDNRLPNASMDSRSIGPKDLKKVGGRAILRIFPLNKMGLLKAPSKK